MTILSVDSSSLPMSVAILKDGALIAEYYISLKLTHSETLMGVLDDAVKRAGTELKDITAIAVTSGPGSFTGLRIGSGTVKGLADALNVPLIPVPTLEVMAYNICSGDSLIVPTLDAKRGNVYGAAYEYEGDRLSEVIGQSIMPLKELLQRVNETGKKTVFTGDSEALIKEEDLKGMTVPVSFAPGHLRYQRAGALSVLANKRYEEGRTVRAEDFKPEYIKDTHAEEERREAERQGKLKELSAGVSVLPETPGKPE